MERAVAIKKLGKMLGKSLGYRVDESAPSAEDRERAREIARQLNERFNAAEKAMRERREAVLAADAEYQQLVADWKRLREDKDKAWSLSHRYKITVGTTNSIFFHVKAQGDSWEQVIDKLQASS